MELSIIRRETTGACKYWSVLHEFRVNANCTLVPNVYNESETITKFEIMDGAPVRGRDIKLVIMPISIYQILSSRRDYSHSFVPWWLRVDTHF